MFNSLEREIKEQMTICAKERKAKVSTDGIYKKEGQYFWFISIRQYSSLKYVVSVGIKPWKYDELLFSITHPEDTIRFTDKLRWHGFAAMSFHTISKTYYPIPPKDDDGNVDLSVFSNWCNTIYNESIQSLDNFCKMIESEHIDLDGFYIANVDSDILTAAFAYISRSDFKNAERLLLIAQEEQKAFNRSYGSYSRDLRDVLLDYCRVKQEGIEWSKARVLGKSKT